MKDTDRVILLTGAAGFIGSYLLGWLNREGYSNIIIVDDFSVSEKTSNYSTKKFIEKVERKDLFKWLEPKNGIARLAMNRKARKKLQQVKKKTVKDDEKNIQLQH